MGTEDITLQKKQRVLMGIVIAATVLALVLPFFGFYAGLCGVCLALVALLGAIIALFLKAKMFGIIMLVLTTIVFGPLSTMFTANVYCKHKFGIDVYSVLEAFAIMSDYKMQIEEAEEAENFELAYTLSKKSYDYVLPKISSVIEYEIQQAKLNGDLDLVKKLETQRDDLFRALNEELQSKLEFLEEVREAELEEEPVAVEVVEDDEEAMEDFIEVEENDSSNSSGM